jgi:hypothetical protein
MSTRRALALLLALGLAGCAVDLPDAPLDPEDECGTCSGKADGWGAPEEGSCDAMALVEVANEASFAELDDDAGLNRRAVEEIVTARAVAPFETVADVDAVRYVGASTLGLLRDYATTTGAIERCELPAEPSAEIGIISDLDKTVIPPAGDLALPDAPYPGVASLYTILERGSEGTGASGDTTFVTARTPDRIEGIPEWLAEHGVPEGAIETGTSTLPWVAQPEKVRDITAVLEAHPTQSFVLFGDSSHRDPEVYREVLAAFPERVSAALIHQVTATISEGRIEGLHLFQSYPHAAAILVGLGVISEADAWTVYGAAREEGLALEEADFVAMLDANRP